MALKVARLVITLGYIMFFYKKNTRVIIDVF